MGHRENPGETREAPSPTSVRKKGIRGKGASYSEKGRKGEEECPGRRMESVDLGG